MCFSQTLIGDSIFTTKLENGIGEIQTVKFKVYGMKAVNPFSKQVDSKQIFSTLQQSILKSITYTISQLDNPLSMKLIPTKVGTATYLDSFWNLDFWVITKNKLGNDLYLHISYDGSKDVTLITLD
jgi:hypothetical protein